MLRCCLATSKVVRRLAISLLHWRTAALLLSGAASTQSPPPPETGRTAISAPFPLRLRRAQQPPLISAFSDATLLRRAQQPSHIRPLQDQTTVASLCFVFFAADLPSHNLMDIPTRNTFGQFQSSSSEDEQIEEIVSSTENSEVLVEEEDEEEADPEAFAPAAFDECLDLDEHMSEENAASGDEDITIASSDSSAAEEQLNERIEPLPQYTWIPPQHEWDADLANIYQSSNFFDAEIHPGLKRWQAVPAPFSLDANHPVAQYGDARSIGHQTTYYPPAANRDQLPWLALLQAVLQHKNTFDCNNTIYLIVDNRQPREVPHWPPFCAWWNSRRELKGPADEATDIIWITATDQLDSIPYYWTGPLLLCILFPACHIALIDNDCVPLSLFEIADLLKLSQQLPEWRTLLEGDDDSPIQIGMLLVTEPHFEHNAGLVISPASDLYAPDLNAPVDKISEQFLACLAHFLNTSKPPSNPTTAATSGLLHTPLLGVRCTDSLHHSLAWAILGVFMVHTMWPLPKRHPGQKWPARSCSLSLLPTARERNPPITMWARASFEQGCLSCLPWKVAAK